MDPNCSPSSPAKADSATAGSVHSGTLGSEEAEDSKDEEPSSNENNLYIELDDFRRRWQREIEVSPSRERARSSRRLKEQPAEKGESSARKVNDVPQKIEEQARSLFLSGVQAERAGLLERAISYYRRAVQLVPDIEFRVAEYSNDNSNSFSDDSDESSDKENIPCDDVSDADLSNLIERFQKATLNLGMTGSCQPNVDQKGMHISALPTEILIYILKWVVSSDLDLLSLEQVSKVCRGFYVCARDPEIWRLACLRIWDVNIGSPNKYGSWRNMFLQRPHLLYNGAYISKTTYIRYGEPSFQDSNYRPCYLVAYFRYLRFFPDGLVLMLTTPDDPYQSLFKLRHKRPKHPSIQYGRYKLVGSTVMAIVKKPKRDTTPLGCYRFRRQLHANLQEPTDQTYHLELEMKSVKKRANCQLIWKRYSIHMIHRNGQESVSEFDLTPSNFPPFWFSRVKSYTSETESPLK